MSFFERLAEKMLPVANAIGNQRHMQAIRNGLISILPLTIVGSFFVILLNIPIKGYMDLLRHGAIFLMSLSALPSA